MRLAIPLIDDLVAPRFCFAERVLLVDVEEGLEIGRERLAFGPPSFPQRLDLLAGLGVTHLLAGGFNRRYRPMAEGLDIQVHWGWWGGVDDVLRAWFSGDRGPVAMGAMGRGLGRGGRRRRGRRWGPRED